MLKCKENWLIKELAIWLDSFVLSTLASISHSKMAENFNPAFCKAAVEQ